jgi:hypothetical protein
LGDRRCHRVAGDRRQLALDAHGLLAAVEHPALAHEHEHPVVAGLGDGRGDLGGPGVVVVADDLPAVDAALLVAPLDHRHHGVRELLVEPRSRRVAGVVAVADRDRVIGHPGVRGPGSVARSARRFERPERLALAARSFSGRAGARPRHGAGGVGRPMVAAARSGEEPDNGEAHDSRCRSTTARPSTRRATGRGRSWRRGGGTRPPPRRLRSSSPSGRAVTARPEGPLAGQPKQISLSPQAPRTMDRPPARRRPPPEALRGCRTGGPRMLAPPTLD